MMHSNEFKMMSYTMKFINCLNCNVRHYYVSCVIFVNDKILTLKVMCV